MAEAEIAHTNQSTRTLLLVVMLARSIGRVVIGVEREQSHPGTIAPGHSSAAAADPQGIQPLPSRALAALDQLPAQALAALQLLPAHRLKQAQGLEHGHVFQPISVWFIQR